jgi:Aspartyl/Asparaginyl beta-hydroxylase
MLAGNVDVLPLAMALQTQPDLFNEHTFRTTYDGTPHVDVDDVLLRFSAPDKTADVGEIGPVIEDTAPVFYPAWHRLPQVRPLVFDLMRRLEGVALGRVIISRVRPGGRILPHADSDGEYAVRADGLRCHVVLHGLPGSLFHCGEETVQMLSGSAWWFNHRETHSVENNSSDERLHLMIDIQVGR